MNRKQAVILLLLAIVSFTAAFFGRRIIAGYCGSGNRQCWLVTSNSDVAGIRGQLESQTKNAIDQLAVLRQDMYSVVADPCQPDSVVIEKLNSMTAVHHQLVRTTFEDLIAIRDILPVQEKDKLVTACTQLLAEPKSELARRNQYGRRYQGGGNGSRGFRNQKRKGSFGIDERLELTAEQKETLNSSDPNYTDCTKNMTAELLDEMDKLTAIFGNSTAAKEEILQAVDRILEIQGRLELRTLEHLLKIKPYLSSQQRGLLGSMCQKSGCRSDQQ